MQKLLQVTKKLPREKRESLCCGQSFVKCTIIVERSRVKVNASGIRTLQRIGLYDSVAVLGFSVWGLRGGYFGLGHRCKKPFYVF